MNNLMLRWESLTIVDRRTRAVKHRTVGIVEESMLNFVTSDCPAATELGASNDSGDQDMM